MKAKKQFGQNFLIDENDIKRIVSLIDSQEEDLIIEIGPGRGALTKYLINKPSKLICIEIDQDMKLYLDKYTSNRCQIMYEDILKLDISSVLKNQTYSNLYVIGNLPYYITGPIMEKLIESKLEIKKMIFMVQDEVAKRYSANPGTSDYGYMTIYLNYYYDVDYCFFVDKTKFNPIPKVNSAIISLTRNNRIINDHQKFIEFLKICFSNKRKTLKNNLGSEQFVKINQWLYCHGFSDTVRAEEIDIESFEEIYRIITQTTN